MKYYTTQEIAAIFNVTDRAVQKWAKEEGCPKIADNTFNLEDVARWREQFHKKREEERRNLKDQLMLAQLELKQLEIKKERKELVNYDETEKLFLDIFQQVKNEVKKLSVILPKKLGLEDNEIIKEAIDDVFNNISISLWKQIDD